MFNLRIAKELDIIEEIIEPYYSKIKNGEKMYSVRLDNNKYNNLKKNDRLILSKNIDESNYGPIVKITDIKRFKNFNDIEKNINKDMLIFNGDYSSDAVNKFGIVCLGFEQMC